MKKTQPIYLICAFLFVILLVVACTPQGEQMPTALLPAGRAWAEGREIYFVHTEASDPDVAKLLTDMMASPVLYVPGLASAPATAVAQVYVFENGPKGKGPFGFQADVFDNPPGTAGYSPLRNVNLVKWADLTKARELKSVAEIMAAQAAGELTITQPGVIVNMPFVVWDGGKR